MRILLAPDSFKGTLSSLEAGKLLEEAVLSLYPQWETEVVPMADGGEGTVDALAAAAGGEPVVDRVTGPLGNPVLARSLRLPGGGAAGGLGAALLLFLHGTMASGAEKVLELARFDRRLETADLVITGEGRTDGQSGEGKITGRIAAHCKKKGVPCVVLSGSLGEGWESLLSLGAAAVLPAAEGEDIQKSMKEPKAWYRNAAERFLKERFES